jgi:cytidylate kinase
LTGKKLQEKAKRPRIITIDGPAGAGKSTVSKILARRLHYRYLDTGAMYRAVALGLQQAGVDPEDETALKDLCPRMEISFQGDSQNQRLILNGEDVTEKIREPEVGWIASKVSMKRPVREAMMALQRKIGAEGKVVAEGRDTGTVVFPDAEYKIFLSAQLKERAKRRYREFAVKGVAIKREDVETEMTRRDEQDSSRELAPLRPAPGALFIDSTELNAEEVVARILQAMEKGRP